MLSLPAHSPLRSKQSAKAEFCSVTPQREMREALSYFVKSLLRCPRNRWAEQVFGLGPVAPVTCSAGLEGDALGHWGRRSLKTETAGKRSFFPRPG